MLRIALTSVPVDDQEKAERVYTGILGFEKKQDFPVGAARWLTVTTPGQSGGTELLLEPVGHDLARSYQKALFEAGIPAAAFATDDIRAEYERLRAEGVTFRGAPTEIAGSTAIALFEDGCGNLIQIFEAR